MGELYQSDRVYTVGEVADTLRVSRVTLIRAIHKGRLTAFRVEGQWRILGGDALRYLREETQRALSDHGSEP